VWVCVLVVSWVEGLGLVGGVVLVFVVVVGWVMSVGMYFCVCVSIEVAVWAANIMSERYSVQ
jgi:hypothetical protein